jgi:CRP-like cAMP-binding protein
MSKTTSYTSEEIRTFLELYEEVEEESKSLKKLLAVQDKISIFKNIDQLELKAIVYDLKFVKFHFKDYVVEEGDESKEVFFIIDGKCQVFHNKKKVGDLRAGEVFGESGVIFKTKRNATVVCSSETATMLTFKIDEENMEFCAPALATLYKNLAFEINAKLKDVNAALLKELQL